MDLEETDKAYIAGFIDGEGNISIYDYHAKGTGDRSIHFRVGIANSNLEVLEWIKRTLDVHDNISVKKSDNPNWKTAYQLAIQRIGEVYRVLYLLEPYLKVKHEQALLALSFIDNYAGLGGGKLSDVAEGIIKDLALLNSRGPKRR